MFSCEDDIRPWITIEHDMTFNLKMQVPEPEEYVPLINCIMPARSTPDAVYDCLADLDISTTTSEDVTECANSDEGSNLLHTNGVETKNLDPELNFVPWVLFNDVNRLYSLSTLISFIF